MIYIFEILCIDAKLKNIYIYINHQFTIDDLKTLSDHCGNCHLFKSHLAAMESPHSKTPSSRMTQRTPRYRETPSLVWISPRWESSHGGSGSTNGGWLEPPCRWAFLLWLNSLEPEDDGSTQVQGIKGISSFSGKNPLWGFFFSGVEVESGV